MKITTQQESVWVTIKKLMTNRHYEKFSLCQLMKEIAKPLILGASIVLAVIIYILGTRYHAVANQRGFEIYDQITGKEKTFIPMATPEKSPFHF
jgi:hypothetical protein